MLAVGDVAETVRDNAAVPSLADITVKSPVDAPCEDEVGAKVSVTGVPTTMLL